jgi:hypothetical protein
LALSDPWTLTQLRQAVRRELLDYITYTNTIGTAPVLTTGKWWSDSELNQYLNDWQNVLQNQFEFCWSTATLTFTDTTTEFAIATAAPAAMRLDAIYYTPGGANTSTGRLSPRSLADLDTYQRNWRGTAAAAGIDPVIVYQNNAAVVDFWPPPNGTGTAFFEYPQQLNITSTVTATVGTNTWTDGIMSVPAWTKYSAISYCCYRAYARFSPNQDLNKALRRRKQWERWLRQSRWIYDGYFPDKAEVLRPGRKWAGQVLKGGRQSWPTWR